MSLSSGSRIGSYEVVAPLGAGGMGEVYQARDTKLNRSVALKILPATFAKDPERLARFKREAQVLASLNHPNIAAIYGFEDSGETHALVMELVPGPTLAEMISQPMAPADALPIARQIAAALEAAHEQGVVHRDLKPANIKITGVGMVKVLDFGLAKALAPAGTSNAADLANSPTLTSPAMTELGMILGTAGYMAPEQAKGKPVDRRADIWALGVVLFEMLAGEALYRGETVTETIAHVITQPPDWNALPATTPAPVRRLLRRCLEKDPRNRLQSAGDARIEIDEYLAAPADAGAVAAVPVAVAPAPAWHRALPWALAGVLLIALAFALRPQPAATLPPVRLEVRVASSEELEVDPDLDSPIAVLSPDGQTLVYVGTQAASRRLFVRRLDRMESTPLPGTDGASQHFFSADGDNIGFFANGAIMRMPIAGGVAAAVVDVAALRGAAWGDDDSIVYSGEMSGGLSRISAGGGTATTLTTLGPGERTHHWPAFLPDSKAVLFVCQRVDGAYDAGTIEAVRFDSKERKVLIRGGTFPMYAAGRLIFTRQGALFAVPFDPQRLEVRGEPQQILNGFMTSGGAVGAASGNGSSQVSVASNGTVAYLPPVAQAEPDVRLAIVDRSGKITYEYPEAKRFRDPQFSPDEKRLAIRVSTGQSEQIHLLDPSRNTLTQLTFDGGYTALPVWSPDGRQLAYSSNRGGRGVEIYLGPSDGSGAPKALTESGNLRLPTSFSSDGRLLAMSDVNPKTNFDLMVISLADGSIKPFVNTPDIEMLGKFSPDNKWMAYQSQDATGTLDIFVRAYPDGGALRRVSTGTNGFIPYWTKGGRELVYGADAGPLVAVMAVDVTPEGPALSLGKPRKLFELPMARPFNSAFMSATADGQRFAVLLQTKQLPPAAQRHVMLVFNLFK